MAESNRIGAIDFWRGFVLMTILVDHIPGNGLENITPRNFGLSDSAEAFVFLSGLSVGAIYLPRAERSGLRPVVIACLKRAFRLYGVHIALTVAALALFTATGLLSGLEDLLLAHGRSLVFQEPARALPAIAMMSHQLGYFNILPLYIALMLWAPLVLAITLVDARLALAASLAVYVVARVYRLDLPNWPEPGGWFFNPFAWQLLFTLGLVSARIARTYSLPRRPVLVAAAGLAVLFGAFVVFSRLGWDPHLKRPLELRLDLGKQSLGLGRLLHFAALAYLVTVTPALATLVRSRFGRELQRLGRHSLPVFATGSLLAAGGQAGLAVASTAASQGIVLALGIAYTLGALFFLFALARRLDCPATPIPSGPGSDSDSGALSPSWVSARS